jgi:cell division protein ZapA (FtsZ GTPase activity inhibitor)
MSPFPERLGGGALSYSAAAILAFAAIAHADELSDVQAQAKQLREQMSKRLADLEKRQRSGAYRKLHT